MKKVIVCGGGFAGLKAVKVLASLSDLEIVLIDKRNYHVFQPLLYQVATAGLDSENIAQPIRGLLSRHKNVNVLKEEVKKVDFKKRQVFTDGDSWDYDYLVLACGSQHMYFDHKEWEPYAPGLKTIEQALEIRTRILEAFESAEKSDSRKERERLLTFVVIGGGPTGVELSGAIAEMARFTLSKDFRRIKSPRARIILLEAGDRILPMFSEDISRKTVADLQSLGVEVRTKAMVKGVDSVTVRVNDESMESGVVIWSAGVKAVELEWDDDLEFDKHKRIKVGKDLSLKGHPEVFILGDQAHCEDETGRALPGLATVAMQQGAFAGQMILNDIKGEKRHEFKYFDKGKMATIGRSKAVFESGKFKLTGFPAWFLWMVVHVWYLIGFANRILIMMQWFWAYLRYRRGARIILDRNWMFYGQEAAQEQK